MNAVSTEYWIDLNEPEEDKAEKQDDDWNSKRGVGK